MINMRRVKHILISRTDNIGDVLLSLPMAYFLKQQFPEVKITYLVRDYTADLVRLRPEVDGIISWDQLSALPIKKATAFLKDQSIDCVIHVYTKSIISNLMRKAKIKYRIGTSRRIHHWWNCNRLVRFTRAKSDDHEAVLNLKLLKAFGIKIDCSADDLRDIVQLKTTDALSPRLHAFFNPEKFNLIIHPFTNGHTREWPVSHFNALIHQLPKDKFHILVTGSSNEAEKIKQRIKAACPSVVNLAGQCSLAELSQVIAHADGLVANSTGPLHMAAAFGIHALGLFPASAGVDPARWGPIGPKAEYLKADPNCQLPRCKSHDDCFCMESITVDQVKARILDWVVS